MRFKRAMVSVSDSVSSRVLRTLRRSSSRKLSGFTLAELIVVVSILAVLATIGFLALSGYSGDARDATVKANVRSVATAISSESAATGNSPRYYIVHDPAYALSGAFAYVDGNPAALTWGDIGQPPADSNYTAGKPDYEKLKLDPEKFRVSASGLPGKTLALALAFPASVPGTPANAAFDPASQMAAAFDSKSVAANGAPRNTGYFQVAGISPDTGAVSVSGNFPAPTPAESASGAVSGLLKNPNATGTDAGITAIADGENLNVAPLASCVLPWGGKVAHNATVTAYQSATAAFGTSCVSEQRKCNDGALSGTFEVQNCSVTAAAACALPWGGTVPHGDVATAYSEASIPFAAAYGCADRKQDRECVDGTLSGSVSYDKEACVKGEASACAANASYSKNAHTYSVPLLAHGADSGNLTSADVSENHGVFRYSLTLSCNDGAYANENESGPAVASCDAGYAWDAGSSSCKAAVNGTCGTAAKSYANSASSYGSDAFCALGNGIAAPASPTFPGAGASVTWTCGGSFGGSASPTCTASRGSCATAPSFPNMGALTVGNPTSIGQAWTYWAGTCGFACNANYTWNGSDACTDQTSPTLSSVTTSAPACNTVRFTVNGASDAIGLASSPYSFDGGTTWQTNNYADYSGTSYNLNANLIKLRDVSGNLYSYASGISWTSTACGTTVVLMHFDGANGSTTFTDATGRHSFSRFGSAVISTATSKFGVSSAYFNGSSAYCSTPASSDFDFGTGDFTIEWWERAMTSDSTRMGLYSGGSVTGEWEIYSWGSTPRFWLSGVTPFWSDTIWSWVHMAVVRSNGTIYEFIEGSLKTTGSLSSQVGNASIPFFVGTMAEASNIYIDELRITKGLARYTSNFTPSNTAFP